MFVFERTVDQNQRTDGFSDGGGEGLFRCFDQVVSERRNVEGHIKGLYDKCDELNQEIQTQLAARHQLLMKYTVDVPVLQSSKECFWAVRLFPLHEHILIVSLSTVSFFRGGLLNSSDSHVVHVACEMD